MSTNETLPTYDTIMEANGVELYRHNDPHHGHWYVVDNYNFDHPDANRGRVRVVLGCYGAGEYTVGIDAEWRNDKPGELASFTQSLENGLKSFTLDDNVSVSDDGVLTALTSVHRHRPGTAGLLDMCSGFVVHLPRSYVAPVRQAIEIVRDEAKHYVRLSASGPGEAPNMISAAASCGDVSDAELESENSHFRP